MPTTSAPIVVAVGRQGAATTVDYAAREALRQDRGLRVVHVADHPRGDFVGAAALASSVCRARTLVSDLVPVTSVLTHGPAVDAIVAAAQDASLVVVGRRPESRWVHPYVRSVTAGVAAGSVVPVVSVPDGWERPTGVAQVTVGLDDVERSAGILREGFAAARAAHARLTVVSTWWRPAGSDRHDLTQVDDTGWDLRVRAGIDAALADVREAYDEVLVEVLVRNARPGDELVEASRDATLLVLGRHDPLLPTGSHLGPVARSVLRAATCPVLLAAPRPTHQVRGGNRQRAGRA